MALSNIDARQPLDALATRALPATAAFGDLPDEQRTSRSYAEAVRKTLKHHHVAALPITDAMRAEWVRIVTEFMGSTNPKRQHAGARLLMEGQKYGLALAQVEIEASIPKQVEHDVEHRHVIKVIAGIEPEGL